MMNDPVVLLEETNTRGTLQAVIEQDDRTAYFYLFPGQKFAHQFEPRACWLRNLKTAPATRDFEAMSQGQAPMIEASFCEHPDGLPPLEAERLSIVWLESGDGAAALYDDKIIGFIPGWTLYSDQPIAYASSCTGSTELSMMFPMNENATPIIYGQVARATEFWNSWEGESNTQWGALQEKYLSTYEEIFGTIQKYYAIDGDQWPPMAIGEFEKDGIKYFLSMGIGIRAMPWVDYLYNDNASGFRRMELAIAIDMKDFDAEAQMRFAEIISGMADSPWRDITWYGEGHTNSAKELPGEYESLILSAALYNGSNIALPDMYGDKLNLYWCTPITLKEREYAHSIPNGGYTLLEEMINEGMSHVVRKRASLK